MIDYADRILRGWQKYIFVPLHAWELSVVGLVALFIWYHPLLLAAVLGQLSHVITDHFANNLKPWGYSFIYRAANRFLGARIMKPRGIEMSREDKPLWAYLEPTIWRIVRKRRMRKRMGGTRGRRAESLGD